LVSQRISMILQKNQIAKIFYIIKTTLQVTKQREIEIKHKIWTHMTYYSKKKTFSYLNQEMVSHL
jgi:hypothetical protein